MSALNEQFSIPVEIVNNRNNRSEENVAYTVVLSWPETQQATSAYDAIDILFTIAFKKIILDKNLGYIKLIDLFSYYLLLHIL